jgi:hypothetical protein
MSMTTWSCTKSRGEREVCRRLLEAERLAIPSRVGFASLREYAERRLGLNGRQTEERLRVGRALVDLPALDGALSTGELRWSAVRELTRLAVPETERAWRAWASGKTSRQVEKAIASRQPGDLPSSRPDPALVKHRLSFEVRAETSAPRRWRCFVRCRRPFAPSSGAMSMTTWSCTKSRGEREGAPTMTDVRRIRWRS